ncbi:hypothetical protein H257_09158 [Aphanomyces astaci]|uniref:Uncharacterized protein n=1 Tax=Aphanomyces astaci TaxID=112090 RepID=W4GAI3_APHAT|nr:hypothetical protein H257_09158 [Aphanomyces astaci]ETV76675.1 hypothetical protein H257_09158 [Aphanomyces astaci]|eukprot:XP_009833587.1 hypothetical protein H257_09158 [Aphanomyces astaci]
MGFFLVTEAFEVFLGQHAVVVEVHEVAAHRVLSFLLFSSLLHEQFLEMVLRRTFSGRSRQGKLMAVGSGGGHSRSGATTDCLLLFLERDDLSLSAHKFLFLCFPQ